MKENIIVDNFLKDKKNILLSENIKLSDVDYFILIQYCRKYKTKNLIKYFFSEAKKRNDLIKFINYYTELKFSLKYKKEIYSLNNSELVINMLFYDKDYNYYLKNNIDNIFNILNKVTDIELINKLLYVVDKSNNKYKYNIYFEIYLSILNNKIIIDNNIKSSDFLYYINNFYLINKKDYSKLFQLGLFKYSIENNLELIKVNNYLSKNNTLLQFPNNKVSFIYKSNSNDNLKNNVKSDFKTYIVNKYNYMSILSNIDKYF